jgi:hypothetical protein
VGGPLKAAACGMGVSPMRSVGTAVCATLLIYPLANMSGSAGIVCYYVMNVCRRIKWNLPRYAAISKPQSLE